MTIPDNASLLIDPAADALSVARVRLALRHHDNEAIFYSEAHRLWATRALWAPHEDALAHPPLLEGETSLPTGSPFDADQQGRAELVLGGASLALALVGSNSMAPSAISRLPWALRCHLLASVMLLTGHTDAPDHQIQVRWAVAAARAIAGAPREFLTSQPMPAHLSFLLPYTNGPSANVPRAPRRGAINRLRHFRSRLRPGAVPEDSQRAWVDGLSDLGVAIVSTLRAAESAPILSRRLREACPPPAGISRKAPGDAMSSAVDDVFTAAAARCDSGDLDPAIVVQLAELYGAIIVDEHQHEATARDAVARVAEFVHATETERPARALAVLAAVPSIAA